MPLHLPLHHNRRRHALVTNTRREGRVVLAPFVNLVRIHLRETGILIGGKLFVKTDMLGVLDLVLVNTIGTLAIRPMIAAIDVLLILLFPLTFSLFLLLGHNVAFIKFFLLLLFLLVNHGLGIIKSHAGRAGELESAV